MPDNRELALLIVGTSLLVFVLANGQVRKAAISFLGLLFWSRLTVAALGAGVWLGTAIFIMERFDVWDLSNVKDTLLWFATGGCLLVFQGMGVSNPNAEFKGIVAEQFQFALFFELVVNAYPFPLPAELGLLIGTGFLAMAAAYTELQPGREQAAHVFKFMLGLVVIFVAGFAFYNLFTQPGEVFNKEGLRVFGLPIYFTLILLPYGYMLTVYAAYETLFVERVAQHAMMPPDVRRYAKWQLFWLCKLNANAVRRAKDFLSVDFRWSKTRDVVDAELLCLREELHWKKPPAAE